MTKRDKVMRFLWKRMHRGGPLRGSLKLLQKAGKIYNNLGKGGRGGGEVFIR